MTAARPTTRDLFQQAVDTVRNAPLGSPAPGPAFTLPRATPRPVAPGNGNPAGLPGDLWDTRRRVAAGELRPETVLSAAVAARLAHDARFHAFEPGAPGHLQVNPGPLAGIPVSIKDVIDVAGMPTLGSSASMAAAPALSEGAAVARLRAAGAAIAGKAVTHEFALGVTTPQSSNPWDDSRIPGGSSGGSAISLVTGMALGSLGTDTRASIRVPAALCGLVGFKASLGVVPVDGWMTLSWTMDHLAPMARSVRDVAFLMDVLTSGPGRFTSGLGGTLAGVRLGWSAALLDGMSPGVAAVFSSALDEFRAAGARVVEVAAPSQADLDLANGAGMVVSRAEAARYHAERGTDLARCTDETRSQIEEANRLLATDYLRAMQLRGVFRGRLERAFESIDALVMPTTKVTAPLRSEAEDYLLVLSENCIPWSFVDFPAISLFSGMDGHLPVGLQLVGPPAADEFLLALAHAAEQALPSPPAWLPQ